MYAIIAVVIFLRVIILKNLISASILGANFANIENEIEKAKNAGVDWLHFDVMDGVFVDNISFGLPVLSCIKKITDMPLDVHLMIVSPEKYIERFCQTGADILTFHVEATEDIQKCIDLCKKNDTKVGLTVKPNTPIDIVYPYLEQIDMILIMTVEPGFGGQGFIYDTLGKIKALRDEISRRNLDVDIEVDGGISDKTASAAKENGANVLVSGSYLFNADDMKLAVETIR